MPRGRLVLLAALAAIVLLGAGFAIGALAAGGRSAASPTPSPTASPQEPPGTVPARFAGTWSGTGTYLSTDLKKLPMTINVDLPVRSRTGTWNARFNDQFDCSGVLQVQHVTTDRLVMYQYVTSGQRQGEGCELASAGYMTLGLRSDGTADCHSYGGRRELDLDQFSTQLLLRRA